MYTFKEHTLGSLAQGNVCPKCDTNVYTKYRHILPPKHTFWHLFGVTQPQNHMFQFRGTNLMGH